MELQVKTGIITQSPPPLTTPLSDNLSPAALQLWSLSLAAPPGCGEDLHPGEIGAERRGLFLRAGVRGRLQPGHCAGLQTCGGGAL